MTELLVLNEAGRIYGNEEPMCDDPFTRSTVSPGPVGQEGPADQEGSAGPAARAKGSPILLILAPERRRPDNWSRCWVSTWMTLQPPHHRGRALAATVGCDRRHRPTRRLM